MNCDYKNGPCDCSWRSVVFGLDSVGVDDVLVGFLSCHHINGTARNEGPIVRLAQRDLEPLVDLLRGHVGVQGHRELVSPRDEGRRHFST